MLDYETESSEIAVMSMPSSNKIEQCPFCGSKSIEPRSDGQRGFECLECESIFLGDGKGIKIESGVIPNIAEAKNLQEELKAVKDEIAIAGPFRGHAQLFQIPEITLPTMAGVIKAAVGFTVERFPETIFLTRSK